MRGKLFPGILATVLFSVTVRAQTPAPLPKVSPSPAPTAGASNRHSLKYVAPKGVATGTRKGIDAGSRGWTTSLPAIYVLAPDHTGLTTRAQPTFFWYQSGPTNTRMELTLIARGKPGWLLRVGLDKAEQAGIHRLSLERYRVTLTPGVVYRWSVALVPNPNGRSQDLIASDTIQRIEPDAELTSKLSGTSGWSRASVYGNYGIWYDLLETINDEIETMPKRRELRQQRAALFEQVGLAMAAAGDQK
jgi:hypothetical protein